MHVLSPDWFSTTVIELSGYTPQIQSPIGSHTNSSLEKRYFLTLESCRCSEIIDFLLENGAFYQIRSSTGVAKRFNFLLHSDED